MGEPSLTGLRTFEAAARLGSFTQAAGELFVTQGAVSHQIRRLERDLGVALFQRQGRSIRLTAEGARLAAAASDAFARLDQAVAAVGRRALDTVLSVSVPPSLATRWLVPRLERFAQRAPELDVRISTSSDAVVDPVREGFDAAICYARFVDQPGVAATLLAAEEVFPVCHPSLLEGRGALRRPDDLAAHTLLHVQPRQPHPDLPDWRKWLRAARVKGVSTRRGPRFSHTALAISAALAAQGLALGRTLLVADDLALGHLVRPFPESFRSRVSYWLVTPSSASARDKTRRFRTWLEEEVARTRGELPS